MGFPDHARSKEWDIAVIGGGINGAGVARDAAMRGQDVILFEKNDFASGTSSKSTKLIHGGLRYLQHYEFGLVFESLKERSIQRNIASHLVKPRKFIFPIYGDSELSSWKLRLGLTIYDLFSLFRGFGWHRFLSASQARTQFEAMNPSGLKSAGLYMDCQMDDARLVIENVLDADRHGATVRNHCEVSNVKPVPNRDLWSLRVEDRRSGRAFDVRCHNLVNATGPWSDRVARHWRDEEKTFVRPTKGAHLVLPSVQTKTAGFFPSVTDDRLIFIIPWQGNTLVGTTDTEFEDHPDGVDVSDDDRDYLLTNVNHHLRGPDFDRADILAEFSGLRPLYDSSGGTQPPGAVSRDHEIIRERESVYSIVGGKYTTYRAIAEETLDTMDTPGRCRTGSETLPGGWQSDSQRATYRDALLMTGQLSPEQVEQLLNAYGRNVIRLTEYAGEMPEALENVSRGSPVVKAQVYYAVLNEYALDPEDVIRRRTSLFTEGAVDEEEVKQAVNIAEDEMKTSSDR